MIREKIILALTSCQEDQYQTLKDKKYFAKVTGKIYQVHAFVLNWQRIQLLVVLSTDIQTGTLKPFSELEECGICIRTCL